MFDRIKDIVSEVAGGGDLGSLSLGGLEKYLDGVSWPIQQDDLVGVLRNNGAPEGIVDRVAGMNLGQVNSPADLLGAIQGSGSGTGETGGTELQGQVDAATQDIRGDVDAASDNAKKRFGV